MSTRPKVAIAEETLIYNQQIYVWQNDRKTLSWCFPLWVKNSSSGRVYDCPPSISVIEWKALRGTESMKRADMLCTDLQGAGLLKHRKSFSNWMWKVLHLLIFRPSDRMEALGEKKQCSGLRLKGWFTQQWKLSHCLLPLVVLMLFQTTKEAKKCPYNGSATSIKLLNKSRKFILEWSQIWHVVYYKYSGAIW